MEFDCSVALFVICAAAGLGIANATHNRIPLFTGLAIGVYLLFSIKVADQWEKVAVLRLGRYIGLRGPGMFHAIPIMDRLSRVVDQRVRVTSLTLNRPSLARSSKCWRDRPLAGLERGEVDSRRMSSLTRKDKKVRYSQKTKCVARAANGTFASLEVS